MQEEIWKPVVGFEGIYEVSNLGRLRSMARVIKYADGRNRHTRERVISFGRPRPNGYYMKCLNKNGAKKYATIHRLVAEAFVPNPHNLEQINHINGDKTDNRAENLEWVSRSYNAMHAVYELGKTTGTPVKPVLCVETGEKFSSHSAAVRAKGGDRRVFWKVIDNPTRTMAGYHWKSI